MRRISSFALLATLLVCCIDFSVAPPPGLRDDQRWLNDPDCPRGGVYKINNNSIRCHCWGHQGYICEPDNGGGGGGGGGGGRRGNGRGGRNGNGGCPPSATVCVINNNANTNSNSNSNSNANDNNNKNGNGNGNKNKKGGNNDYGDYSQYDY